MSGHGWTSGTVLEQLPAILFESQSEECGRQVLAKSALAGHDSLLHLSHGMSNGTHGRLAVNGVPLSAETRATVPAVVDEVGLHTGTAVRK